jgi:hypothetical protein
MDIQKRFAEMLVPVSKKINDECQNFLPDSGKRIHPAAYMRTIFQLIKKELMETLKIVALVKPNKSDWKSIRKIGIDFLEQQSGIFKEEFYERWGLEYFNEKEFETLEKEIAAEYHTFIDGKIIALQKARKKFFYDIIKGVIVGIIGSLIIYYLTTIIFKQPPSFLVLLPGF